MHGSKRLGRWLGVLSVLLLLGAAAVAAQPHRVTFRDDHIVLVDGKPFFPIGLYYTAEEFDDPSGELMKTLRDYGFNTLGFYRWNDHWKRELDMAHELGMKVWRRGVNGLAVENEQIEQALIEEVRRLRDHPALLFWEFQDEPILNKVPVDAARKGQAIVRREDPNHPILVVEWPGAVSRFAEWNDLGNIYATDLYPIPREKGYGRLPNKDITQMRDYLHAIHQARGDAPTLLVLQGWNWQPLEYGKAGYPTPAESRFMAYQSVVHGVSGLFYYGQFHCSTPNTASSLAPLSSDPGEAAAEFAQVLALNRWFWDEHRALFAELKAAAALFVLRDAVDGQRVTVEAGDAGDSSTIEWRTKAQDGQLYVIAVNASDKPVQARLRWPDGLDARQVYVLFEDRQVALSEGVAEDMFEPYGVHIYATTDRLPK